MANFKKGDQVIPRSGATQVNTVKDTHTENGFSFMTLEGVDKIVSQSSYKKFSPIKEAISAVFFGTAIALGLLSVAFLILNSLFDLFV